MVVMAGTVPARGCTTVNGRQTGGHAALTGGLPSVGGGPVCCVLDATPHPTEPGAVPLPVRVTGCAAGAVARASRRGPRSRGVHRNGRPAPVAVRPDGRRDRRPARLGAPAPWA